MQESKTFTVLLDGTETNTIPILNTATIKVIKDYFRNYLLKFGKDPDSYSVKIYLNKVDKLDVDNTTKYDNIYLISIWSKITDGHIVLTHSPNYFGRLYTDAIYQIAMKLDVESLANLCRSDKRMSKICRDEFFWMNKTYVDFGVTDKPVERSWKNHYKLLSVVDVVREHINDNNSKKIDAYEMQKKSFQIILEGLSESEIMNLLYDPWEYLDQYDTWGLFFGGLFKDFRALDGQIYNNGTAGYYDIDVNKNQTYSIEYGFERYFNFGVGKDILYFIQSYRSHIDSRPERPSRTRRGRYGFYEKEYEEFEETYEEKLQRWYDEFETLDNTYYKIGEENIKDFINTVYRGILFG